MNMQYVKGQFVGYVSMFDPIEPPAPKRWYILRVHSGREGKVMKTFRQRGVSAWLPLHTSSQEIKRYRYGQEFISRRNVTSPLIAGVIIIPDFEVNNASWRSVDGIIGLLHMGPCFSYLTPALHDDLRNIEAIANTPKSKRERLFAIGKLVRVINGPFASFCGRVERIDSKARLSVGVDIFGRITPIQLDGCDIEAV